MEANAPIPLGKLKTGDKAKDARKRGYMGGIIELAKAAFEGHEAENPLLPAGVGRAGTYYRVNHRTELKKWSPYLAFTFFAHCSGRQLPVAEYRGKACPSQRARVQLERDLAFDAHNNAFCIVYALKSAFLPSTPRAARDRRARDRPSSRATEGPNTCPRAVLRAARRPRDLLRRPLGGCNHISV